MSFRACGGGRATVLQRLPAQGVRGGFGQRETGVSLREVRAKYNTGTFQTQTFHLVIICRCAQQQYPPTSRKFSFGRFPSQLRSPSPHPPTPLHPSPVVCIITLSPVLCAATQSHVPGVRSPRHVQRAAAGATFDGFPVG